MPCDSLWSAAQLPMLELAQWLFRLILLLIPKREVVELAADDTLARRFPVKGAAYAPRRRIGGVAAAGSRAAGGWVGVPGLKCHEKQYGPSTNPADGKLPPGSFMSCLFGKRRQAPAAAR